MNKKLPNQPGVYFFKDAFNTIIYIGKATSLRSRVGSYFVNKKRDWKIEALLEEHRDIDFIVTKNEPEATLLEAHLIKEYQPKYNVLLKTGNPFIYILFTQDALPAMKMVRTKKEKGTYFGPFIHKRQARAVYSYLQRMFQLSLCNKKIEQGCLDYHIGICAGNCRNDFDETGYRLRLQLAIDTLNANYRDYAKKINEHIALYNKELAFEKSKNLHTYLENFDAIVATLKLHFDVKKYANALDVVNAPSLHEIIPDTLAVDLQEFLHAEKPIESIDCFDISHFQGSFIVGSCVRFVHGIADKKYCRRFRIRTLDQQNDYAALQEIVQRRYKDAHDLPDAILIDGGKGQLHAVESLVKGPIFMSLAKKEECLFCSAYPDGVHLNVQIPVGRTLIALRDYAHHFAVSYHRKRRHSTFKE